MSDPISAGQAVSTGGSKTGYGYRPANLLAAVSAPTLGLSTANYPGGAGESEVEYDEAGIQENPDWNWSPALPVYVGLDAQPTQNLAALSQGAYRLLGVALSRTKLLLLCPQPAIPKDDAAQRPMSIGDSAPYPHQATAAERPLHKDFYGLGGTTTPAPTAAREVTIAYVDDTHVQIRMKGDDGTVRSGTITLA